MTLFQRNRNNKFINKYLHRNDIDTEEHGNGQRNPFLLEESEKHGKSDQPEAECGEEERNSDHEFDSVGGSSLVVSDGRDQYLN